MSNYDDYYELLNLMQQTYAGLLSVANKIQSVGDKYAHPFTTKQYMTLLAILHMPEDEATLVNISHRLGTTKQNTAQIIKSLEKKEVIFVEKSEKDKRSKLIKLTTHGENELMNISDKMTATLMADLFHNFEKEELANLLNSLKKIYAFDGHSLPGLDEQPKLVDFDEDEINNFMNNFIDRLGQNKL